MEAVPDMNENILSNLYTAIVSLDHELRICFINQPAESLLEISATKSLGQPLAELVCGFGAYGTVFYDAIQSGQPYTQRMAELTLPSGGTTTVDFTISPVREDEWPRLLLEMHPLDRYLRIDRDAALQANQKISHQMVRGLAHEIKNPLGGIRGSAELLAKELGSEELREYTQVIIDETDRLAKLVDQMLGPRRSLTPEMTNIHELLERVGKLVQLENNQVEIKKDYDPSIPELSIDSELMYQAILNLARNAMQSMESVDNPALKFATRIERQFTINGTRYRNVLQIDIADNGNGIPEDLKQNLFYPMISGRPEGTGLGLPLVNTVVHQHRGIVEFDSEPGNTTFRVYIPLEQHHE
jgi:two-component system nitrogen regulation sensor histidine kinase GlnL